ncbi:hypothetical protein HWV62_41824 [Athelia sp. TMB]|nr:hypothetical protein HWV62_41824 [Athelia sp. TMB]
MHGLKLQDMNSAPETPLAHPTDMEAACQFEQPECNHISKKTPVVERLPYEILAYIFEEVHSPGLELVLSQVTPQWRDIAVNTPKLWCTIYLRVDRPKQLEFAALYLTRSKGIPVDITVTHCLDDNQHAVVYAELLADHIHHCRQLALYIRSMESACDGCRESKRSKDSAASVRQTTELRVIKS